MIHFIEENIMKYNPKTPVDIKKEIELTLKNLFPEAEPEALVQMMRPILKDIGNVIEKQPALEFNKQALKIHIEESIAKNILEEEDLKKSLKKYTKDLNPKEQLELKLQVKKEMDTLRKNNMNLVKNPKAHQIMINLLVLKHCPKHKLKPEIRIDLALETERNLLKLKTEMQKLLEKLEKSDPALREKLMKEVDNIFIDMQKKIMEEKEPKEEITKLFKLITVFTDPPKDESFDRLTPEQKVKIVTQGSDEGKYAILPRNDIPMPDNIIVFKNTPAALEKEPERSIYPNVRDLPKNTPPTATD